MSARTARAPGWWIPWIFLGFFLVVVAVNATMIWVGSTSWTGLVTESPYDKGLDYNRNLEAAQRQAALGWKAEVEARMTQGFDADLAVAFHDANGVPVDGLTVNARFERPTIDAHDFDLTLAPTGPGTYGASFKAPMTGLWDIHLRAIRGEDMFVERQRVLLK